tara:strand:- start:2692 stop:2925 length:234 start_codon:yes stop_codon:yes gene_type:complete
MRITKARLRQIIREELEQVLEADDGEGEAGDGESEAADAQESVAEAVEPEEEKEEKEEEDSQLAERLRRALIKHLGK